jgi:hypothetical protein
METPRTSRDKNLWDDFRETVRGGLRDLRNAGDDLARQGRLRMDMFQTERRLKSAYEALGEAVFLRISGNLQLSPTDPTIAELTTRIQYYTAELDRLRDEQRKAMDSSAP